MKSGGYGITVKVDLGMEQAEEKVRAALAGEGFGILTEIDVAATLKKKIDVDRGPYKILGACNPHFANRALNAETDIGVLMPCSVVLYPDGEGTAVVAMDPGLMATVSENPALTVIGAEAREGMVRALESLEA